MIELIRQLLGCKQVEGSGHLESVPLTGQLSCVHTYGQLFLTLAYFHGMVPLGIYRTSEASYGDAEVSGRGGKLPPRCINLTLKELRNKEVNSDAESLQQFLRSRMKNLGLDEAGRCPFPQ